MSELFTPAAEIEALTDYKYPAKQIEWLRKNGVRHTVGRSGRPKVMRAELERILLGGVASAPNAPDLSEINGKKTQNG